MCSCDLRDFPQISRFFHVFHCAAGGPTGCSGCYGAARRPSTAGAVHRAATLGALAALETCDFTHDGDLTIEKDDVTRIYADQPSDMRI